MEADDIAVNTVRGYRFDDGDSNYVLAWLPDSFPYLPPLTLSWTVCYVDIYCLCWSNWSDFYH